MLHRIIIRIHAIAGHSNLWPVVQLMATVITVVIASYIVWIHSTDTAAREARISAENRAEVQRCFERNASGPASERFFDVLEVILKNQIIASKAAANATDQQANKFKQVIVKARRSLVDLDDFRARTEASTPTRAECKALAKELGVS